MLSLSGAVLADFNSMMSVHALSLSLSGAVLTDFNSMLSVHALSLWGSFS